MKQEKQNNMHLNAILIGAVIGLLIGLLLHSHQEFNDMPIKTCNNETNTYEVSLSMSNLSYAYSHETKDRNNIIICEEGVEIYDTWINDNKMVATYGDGIKKCMIQEIKEVCSFA